MSEVVLPRQRLTPGQTGIPERIRDMILGNPAKGIEGRSRGIDEVTGDARATDLHHRDAKGMGGTRRPGRDDPSNLVAVSRRTHDWIHANPHLARAGGWIVPSWLHPLCVPVWTLTPYPSWSLLLDDDALVEHAHPEDYRLPARPQLPPWADLAAITRLDPWSHP